jgi:hypothetical protein
MAWTTRAATQRDRRRHLRADQRDTLRQQPLPHPARLKSLERHHGPLPDHWETTTDPRCRGDEGMEPQLPLEQGSPLRSGLGAASGTAAKRGRYPSEYGDAEDPHRGEE